MEWLRPEYQGRESELETREEFFKRTGVTTQSLSSHFTRYANRIPKMVAKFGKTKYFVAAELDEFIRWISENSGTRSESDIKRAEIVRLSTSIEEAEERIARHRESLAKAEKDKARFQRSLKRAESDLTFLEQGS